VRLSSVVSVSNVTTLSTGHAEFPPFQRVSQKVTTPCKSKQKADFSPTAFHELPGVGCAVRTHQPLNVRTAHPTPPNGSEESAVYLSWHHRKKQILRYQNDEDLLRHPERERANRESCLK